MADDEPQDSERNTAIGAATRALAEATAALTRALGQEIQSVVPEVSEAVAGSLREASETLNAATEKVGRTGRRSPGARGREAADRARNAAQRRQEKVDRTRADLLDAGSRVIAAQGYEGASVGDIAAEAGYTKGAIYANFGSKEELFFAIARDRLGYEEEYDATIPGVTSDGVDLDAVTAWLTEARDDPHLLLSLEMFTYALRHPDRSGEMITLHLRTFEVLAENIAVMRHARAGDDTPVEVTERDRDTALGIMSVINLGTLEGMLTDAPEFSARAVARIVARMLED